MKHKECVVKVSELIKQQIDFDTAYLSNEFYYSSVVFCVVDAIYSINSTYASTKKVIQRVAEKLNVSQYRPFGSRADAYEDIIKINRFLKYIEKYDFEQLASVFFENRQRTSAVNGILKAQAVVEFLRVLKEFGINELSDVRKIDGNLAFEDAIKSIRGQSSGLSLKYFYMLSGDENYIKIDRHLTNFVSDILEKQIDQNEAEQILMNVAEELKKTNPTMTPRQLDHEIWKLMSNKN